ncbi:ankyrin repeat domain-containing protein [Paractinoplanes lichenicola]|uniref:Ankyrin repeat domain-containing protein n=1 Tax=Paractinoplanes lichenicola TaxID=2802976 RepID=A0ABS1VTJ3_9ACTN|nr:ankyrin repeat domain-containing protein [Actinoplanes lichenicola]MBL7257785.1 ankyrin repeat domain-containing protein [Actinoplanes lichenicola]
MIVDQRLVDAVKAGDAAQVRAALRDGAHPDARDGSGPHSPAALVIAAQAGRLDLIALLLEGGAQLGPLNPHTASALRVAVLRSHVEVVRDLVAREALAAEAASRRGSVLTSALQMGAFEPQPAVPAVLEVLLRGGATARPGEEAPLIAAVMSGSTPAVLRLLLDHGADADVRRSDGAPALVVAARRRDHAAVDVLLLAGADPDAVDGRGRTALMHAVERGDKRVAGVLLTAGADRAVRSPDGMTALLLAQGWQRQNIQFTLGEHVVGQENVPISRSLIRVTPTSVRLSGDRSMFEFWARVLLAAVDDLGDDEWEDRTSRDADTARRVAGKLRDGGRAAPTASWWEVELSDAEFAVGRKGLVESGVGEFNRFEIVDLLDDLDRQWQVCGICS